jgi:drug/metabolite transporter (DMT)-like permease
MSDNRFPFAVPLTVLHMGISYVFCKITLASPIAKMFVGPAQDQKESQSQGIAGLLEHLRQFLPLGLFFGASIVSGNSAYEYVSVSFLQMLKEAVIMMVYLLSVAFGMEIFKMRNLLVLTFVTTSAMIAVGNDLHFVWIGLCLQLFSSCCQASTTIAANSLMIRKVDPLTMVLNQAPVVILVLSPFLYFFWSPDVVSHFLIYKYQLAFSGLLAFVLQLVNAVTIQQLSPTGLTLVGVIKDLIIVVLAVLILGESLSMVQIAGFSCATLGIGVYSSMKLFPTWFEPVENSS